MAPLFGFDPASALRAVDKSRGAGLSHWTLHIYVTPPVIPALTITYFFSQDNLPANYWDHIFRKPRFRTIFLFFSFPSSYKLLR